MTLNSKKICFRTKGNHKQGMGDVMGSLALAEELRSRGHIVSFVVDDDIEAKDVIKKYGYDFIVVKTDTEDETWDNKYFDISIVNLLTTSYNQLSIIRQHCRKLVTIDDKGDASKKLADLRINPLYYDEGAFCDYKYIPLHPVFQTAHEHKKIIRNNIKNILVTMGGSDTYGFTPQILEVLLTYPEGIQITGIIGAAFKHDEALNRVLSLKIKRFDIFRSVDIKTMCRWIQWADVAICSGGNTLFEMACYGTPVVAVCGESFEEETAYRLEKMGFGRVISFNKQLNSIKLKALLDELQDKSARENQSRIGMQLIDGMGTKRIVDTILGCRQNLCLD